MTTAKIKNASPNTGSSCRSGHNCGWLRPTRAFGVAAVCRISLLVLAFVGLGFATSPADAAIAVDATSVGQTTTNIVTISHTTSGTSRLMLVGVSIVRDPAVPTVTSITYNGVGLSLVGTRNTSDSFARAEIWQLTEANGLPTGTFDVVVNLTGAASDGMTVGVMTFTGVDQATPLGAFNSATADSTIASVNVASAVGELVFAAMVLEASGDQPLSWVGAGTERWDLYQAPAGNGAGGTRDATGALETMSWTFPADKWAIGGVSIKPGSLTGMYY